MPILTTPPGPTPSLLTLLTPVAANPIAPVGEGGEGGFADVIAGISSPGMMLDGPPALPEPGTSLPPERPDVAASPRPIEIDIEQVMVGSALPKPIVANMPAAAVPADAAPAPQAAPLPEETHALVPGPKPYTPRPDAPITRAHVAPELTRLEVASLPEPVKLIIDQPIVAEPADLPSDQPEQDASLPADKPGAVQLELAPPPVPTTPISQQPAPLQPVVVEPPEGEVLVPVVVLPMPARVAPPQQPPLPGQTLPRTKATVERPLEPAPRGWSDVPDQAQVATAPAKPAPSAPPRPDFTIPAELARQVAQIIRPVTSNDNPVVDIPANDFAPLTPAAQPQPVAAPGPVQSFQPSQPAFVDTARAEWMQSMIDRIGDIAQADSRREAQIRLRPDALGTVDVKIVERDDRLQVTLNADTAQARQLLSEHAPRLAELAEARGLRFAQTDIGGGAQQQERRPAPEQPATPLRPRSAQADADASSPDDADRIA